MQYSANMTKADRHDLAVARKQMREYLRGMSVDEIESAIEFTEQERARFEHELWQLESMPSELFELQLKRAREEARIGTDEYFGALMDCDDDSRPVQ